LGSSSSSGSLAEVQACHPETSGWREQAENEWNNEYVFKREILENAHVVKRRLFIFYLLFLDLSII
jgi:hypothetical protein